MQNIFKIVSQTEAVTINTQNGQMQKSTLVMQEVAEQVGLNRLGIDEIVFLFSFHNHNVFV